MSDKTFEWTNELIMEFVNFHENRKGIHWLSEDIEDFKKSKEKDMPKEWEIVSFIYKNGTIDNIEGRPVNALWYKNDPNWKIHAVKRLSDGEVFTIGDKVLWLPNDLTTITEFRLINGELAIYGEGFGIPLENISKVKPKVPLFTTSDLHTVYEYDTYPVYKVDKNFQILYFPACNCMNYKDSMYFYNYDKALEYINLNKPCLSIKDVEDLCEKRDFIGTDYLKRLLIERVKQIQNP